jgi:hypothetical protein
MTALAWLAIPLVALLIGLISAARMSRPRRPAEVEESVESFVRFRQALAAQSRSAATRSAAPRPHENSPSPRENLPPERPVDRTPARVPEGVGAVTADRTPGGGF